MKEISFIKDKRKYLHGVVLAFAALAAGLFLYFYFFYHGTADGTVMVEIPKNATGREIGEMLEEKGVIRSATVFRAMLLATGNGKALKSGYYTFRRGSTVAETISVLKNGKEEVVKITVPEGFTAVQIADVLQKAGLECYGDFLHEAETYAPFPYMYGPEEAKVKGEGFLFADTYEIPKSCSARQIADMMYRRTDEMLTPALRRRAEEKHLSIHALMTIASMVEREARLKEDQVPIASVILARLEKQMPLQIDATVQYALGRQKEELTIADTKIDSPYNTYERQGLPPGPISSPGMDAVRAVLDAAPGEYLYYVAEKDGRHVFTKTFEEHQAEIDRIYGTDD